MKKTQHQIAVETELKKLRAQFEIARKIVTPEGFYQTWFNSLPHYETYKEAFDVLNELHYNTVLPARYKYSNYHAFRTSHKKRIDGIKNR